MPDGTQSYASQALNGLSFSNIVVSETDTGSVLPFNADPLPSVGTTATDGFSGIEFSSFLSGAIFAGSSISLHFTYDVTATAPGLAITALQQGFVPNAIIGDVTMTIVEKVYDANNTLVGTTFTDLNNFQDPSGTYYGGDLLLGSAYSALHVDVTVVASVAASNTQTAFVDFSELQQGFATTHVLAAVSPGSLSGHVFLDGNADGAQGAADANLAGITVQLLDSAGNPVAGQVATTDANGSYRFTGLAAGSYAVQVTAPAGDSFSPAGTDANATVDSIVNAAGRTAPVAVVGGAETKNQNAGLYVPATFTAHVYNDASKDGLQGGSEAGQAGVTVQLLTGAGVATGQTAVTDANGNATFSGLVPGSYQVAVATPAGEAVTQSSNIAIATTLSSGQAGSATLGLFTPGTLSGHVFLDGNANGVQEAGDTNLAGITVQLLDGTGAAIAGQVATTDANGFYRFTGLVAGSYAVQVAAPAGDKFSQAGTNANAALDSIVNAAGQTAPIVVAGAETLNQNAAAYAPATFTAHVYNDANNDGVQDGGEAGQIGITVQLLNGAGVATGQTAVTDADGNVSFTGLLPGSYQVAVAAPGGTKVTQASNVGSPVTLASGGTAAATEGLFTPGALSGHVFLDANTDGVQQAGDTNLSGITVQLLDGTGAVIAGRTATTDASGSYAFTGLVAGSYAVQVTAPAGDKFSQTGTNANAALDSVVNAAGRTAPVQVAAGATTVNQNAAVYAPATFTAHVYNDANKDGAQGAGESGQAGVTVRLLTGAGVATGQTAVTDASGNVSFAGLLPGSYEVAVVTPSGRTVTQSSNIGTPTTLASGQAGGATLGLFTPGALSGHVFLDGNADGVQEAGDINLSGLTVQLLDSTGKPVAGQVATTDANGFYRFTGLVAGSYSVQVTAPAGDKFSQAGTNANAALDSIVNAAGQTAPVAVVAGAETINQTAAVYAPATFTAHIYADANKDGAQGTGEKSLSGVTVNLLTGAGAATGQSAVTDGNGNVSFTGLLPGSYQVAVAAPAGSTVTQATNIGTANTLVSGGTAPAVEGLFMPGALSGHVFLDASANGVQEAGDTNLSGLTVQLLDSTGKAVAGQVATTDANGFYRFTGLVAGSYAVQVTAPAGDKFSQAGTNANAALDSIVNSAGQTAQVPVVAGAETLNQNAAVYAPATFTAHVYNDANKDGVQGTGEKALAGVTVKLLTGTGVATGQTAVTDANGNVSFAGLTPGSYQVAVVTPAGDTVTQATNVGKAVTLASGGTAAATEGLYVPPSAITIVKTPSVAALVPGGCGTPPLTYTFTVTNTGQTALSGVTITDVTNGDASTAFTVTDPNTLAAGASWTYTTGAMSTGPIAAGAPSIGSGHGFQLGDAAKYAVMAFNPRIFTEAASCGVGGSVGVGSYGCVSATGSIRGDLVTTGVAPGGCTSYSKVGNSVMLAGDIQALTALSSTLAKEAGTAVNLCYGGTLQASAGKLDAAGNEVFQVNGWSTCFTVCGDGSRSVVLNVGPGATPYLGNLQLSGGITADQVLINYTGTWEVDDLCGGTTNATLLAPNAKIKIDSAQVNGHVLGGGAGQDFLIGCGSNVHTPAPQSYGLTDVATVTATAATGGTVTAFTSAHVEVAPSGSGLSVGGCAPSDCTNLVRDFGQAAKLEFVFKPGSQVCTQSQCGIASTSVGVPSGPSFILVSNNASDSATVGTNYYEGVVTAGSKFYADASASLAGVDNGGGFSAMPGACLYAHIFSSETDFLAGKAAVQEIKYDTSGAHGMSLHDTVGSLQLVGYVSTQGKGYVVA